MSDIFEEVEEKLREDKLQTWWNKYGGLVIGGAVALVLGVGASNAWSAWSTASSRSAAEKYAVLAKQVETDPATAEPKLAAFAKSASGGYRALALMDRAGALAANGDTAAAIRAFDEAAKASSEPLLKQSAQLRAAYLAAETESFANLQARLQPMIDARGPFSYLARELIGVQAWKAGNFERARTEFAFLQAAFDAPSGVRVRAERFLVLIGPPAASAAAKGPDAPAATPKSGDTK